MLRDRDEATHRLLQHLRSNVVAYLALSVALGGTSYAAASLPRNSVGTTQLKSNAVTSAKVKNRTLTTSDLSTAAIKALSGKAGPAGAQGLPGAPGAAGAQGATGAQGEQGLKGDKGATGVDTGWGRGVAGASLAGGEVVVADLAGTNGSGSGPLTVPVQSRVYVTGSVNVANNATGAPSRATCTARNSSAGATDLLFDSGPPVLADVHQADAGSSSGSNLVYASLSVGGAVLLVDPGTYNLGIVCTRAAGTGGLLLNSATVNVIAVPEP